MTAPSTRSDPDANRDRSIAARLLWWLSRVRPYYWSSFYRRAKTHAVAPRPTFPAVTFDVTRLCNFSCDFCMAGDLAGLDHMSEAVFTEALDQLSGLRRVTLLGGEPTLHPSFAALVTRALRHAGEVEVYTNGSTLTRDGEAPASWPRSERFTTVFSVDRAHRDQHPTGRFDRLLGALLVRKRSGAPVRFNVTDARLHSRGYLDARTIGDVLESYHPELAALFVESERRGRLEEDFVLNPVVIQGRTLSAGAASSAPGDARGGSAEYLNVGDFVLHPDLVVSPVEGGGASRARLLTSINLSWAACVPASADLGVIEADSLASQALDAVCGRALPFARFPYLRAIAQAAAGDEPSLPDWRALPDEEDEASLVEFARHALRIGDVERLVEVLRVQETWATWRDWQESPQRVFAERAARLFAYTREAPSFPLMISAAEPQDPWTLPVMRELLALHDRHARPTVEPLLDSWRVRLFRHARAGMLPCHDGIARRREEPALGRPQPMPLDAIGLDTGWGRFPAGDLGAREVGDFRVKPRILRDQAGLRLDFPGLLFEDPKPWGLGEGRASCWRRLTALLAVTLGPDLFGRLVAPITDALDAVTGAVTADVSEAWREPCSAWLPDLEDPACVLRSLTFDPKRGRPVCEDGLLFDLLIAGPTPRWTTDAAASWRAHLALSKPRVSMRAR